MSDSIGLKLGNYRIVRLIGRGGFANVYLGEHIYLKIPAAIKVLNVQLMNDALEGFLNEARIIALLEHPRIVRVLEFGVEGGITPFLVMNYAENGTLRQRYPRKSTLPLSRILSYTKQLAEALQYAHDHGVIHRDVKPENMLLGKNQRIQLSDFGLALLAQNQPRLTGSAGTTAYMAPEQLQGNPCRASDQYALGVVVYEWFCGSLPFTGSEREMTIQQLYASPPSLRTKVPDISSAIEKIIMKALAKDPQARFATIQEFAQALEHAVTPDSLLDTGEGRATSPIIPAVPSLNQADTVSSEGSSLPMQQQEAINAPSASTFFPQLPLLVYESPLTNSGRILQPSLGPSIYSQGEPSLPTTLSSQDDGPHSSSASLSLSATTDQQFSALSTPTFLSAAQSVTEKQSTSFLQAHILASRKVHIFRRTALIALIGMAIIGLILLMGRMFIETRSVDTTQKASLNQNAVSPTVVPTNSTTSAASSHGTGSSSNTHRSIGNPPIIPTHPGSVLVPTPAVVPPAGTTPTPVPPAGTTPTPVPSAGTTPTPVVPLTVDIVDFPKIAVAGSTITVVTQASRGGVTIALNGLTRHFGQQTADSQGIATFQITVPLRGKAMFLTATATDTNGDQAQSGRKTIKITID